jgi:hypothetical protein
MDHNWNPGGTALRTREGTALDTPRDFAQPERVEAFVTAISSGRSDALRHGYDI